MAAHIRPRHELPPEPQPRPLCTCKGDIEAKLLAQYFVLHPKATGHKVALQGYGFTRDGYSLRLQPFMKFKASADHPTATGSSRHRAEVGVMHFSYCPFCGQSIKSP